MQWGTDDQEDKVVPGAEPAAEGMPGEEAAPVEPGVAPEETPVEEAPAAPGEEAPAGEEEAEKPVTE